MAPSGTDSLTRVSFESLIGRVRELQQHCGYLPSRYLQSLRGQIISSRDHSVMMSGDSIIDSIRLHRLHVCDPVSPTAGSSRDGTRLFHSCSRCLVLPLLIRRLDPSPRLSRRRCLGRRSWVGAPRLVRLGYSFCPFYCSYSYRLWVDHRSPSGVASSFVSAVPSGAASMAPPAVTSFVSSGSEGCVPQLPACQAQRLRSLLQFPLLSFYGLSSCSSSSSCASFGSLFHLRCLLPLLSLWVLLFQSPSSLGVRWWGGGIPGATEVSAANATLGCRLPDSDQAGIYSDPLNFLEGKSLTPEFVLRLQVPFDRCYHLLPLFFFFFFPEVLPSGSQPSQVLAWNDGRNLRYTCRIYVGWGSLRMRLFAR